MSKLRGYIKEINNFIFKIYRDLFFQLNLDAKATKAVPPPALVSGPSEHTLICIFLSLLWINCSLMKLSCPERSWNMALGCDH